MYSILLTKELQVKWQLLNEEHSKSPAEMKERQETALPNLKIRSHPGTTVVGIL
jgi:hypothetical protein